MVEETVEEGTVAELVLVVFAVEVCAVELAFVVVDVAVLGGAAPLISP